MPFLRTINRIDVYMKKKKIIWEDLVRNSFKPVVNWVQNTLRGNERGKSNVIIDKRFIDNINKTVI